MSTFVEERINSNRLKLWDTIPHLKIQTLSTLLTKQKMKADNDKVVTVKADRDILGRLVNAAKSRDIYLR